MDINGASAIVTGGASGIGAAVARRLAAQGATVVVADLQADKGEALAEEIKDSQSAEIGITIASNGTTVLEAGHDVRQVQVLLGHSALKTTMIYTHVMNKPAVAVTSPLDRLAVV